MGNQNRRGKEEVFIFEIPLFQSEKPVKESSYTALGTTPLANQLGLKPEQTNGHWCSRCQGIWFGYTLEAECPVCGNRRG